MIHDLFVLPLHLTNLLILDYRDFTLKTSRRKEILRNKKIVVKIIFGTVLHSKSGRCQFHQHFYIRIFRMSVVSAAFSSYILALAKNLYA